MGNHTPGPWMVSEKGPFRKQQVPAVYAADSDLRYVAFCADPNEMNTSPTDNLANAHVIAAAPDLLESCKRAEKFIDAILSFYGQGLNVADWHKNGDLEPFDNFVDENSDGGELEALRAAIAKAKGEQ